MARGGYQVLDIKNKDLTIGEATEITGTYETLEGNYRKAILLSNLVIGGVEYPNRFVEFGTEQSKFVTHLSIDGGVTQLKLTIDDNDMVKIENN